MYFVKELVIVGLLCGSEVGLAAVGFVLCTVGVTLYDVLLSDVCQ